MDSLRMDLLGVPWLSTGLITAALLVVAVIVGQAAVSTYRQRKKLPTSFASLDDELEAGVCPHVMEDLEGPGRGKSLNRAWIDRIAPLFYERTERGTWKVSLGRVSFWLTMSVFLSMCVMAMVSLRNEQDVGSSLTALYLGVLSMLFMTNLGLLAYNLGSKFSDPMKVFIKSWSLKNAGGSMNAGDLFAPDPLTSDLGVAPVGLPSEEQPERGSEPPLG